MYVSRNMEIRLVQLVSQALSSSTLALRFSIAVNLFSVSSISYILSRLGIYTNGFGTAGVAAGNLDFRFGNAKMFC